MTIAVIQQLIDNDLVYPESQCFAAILGAQPSKGARSPALWNAAFSAHRITAEMLPMDVAPDNLAPLLKALQANPSFIGGAIAMPHKEAVANLLGNQLTPEAQAIGAVNCLYRNANGVLVGTNTDGEASRVVLEREFGPMRGKSILLLGPGGAGKAVAAYLSAAVSAGDRLDNQHGRLLIAGRRVLDSKIVKRLGARDTLLWCDIDRVLPEMDVVVNCTSLGTGEEIGQSPLSMQQLLTLPSHAIVYDINYLPPFTRLLEMAKTRNLGTLNGVEMNIEQAILAYGHAAPQPKGTAATRFAMETKRQNSECINL